MVRHRWSQYAAYQVWWELICRSAAFPVWQILVLRSVAYYLLNTMTVHTSPRWKSRIVIIDTPCARYQEHRRLKRSSLPKIWKHRCSRGNLTYSGCTTCCELWIVNRTGYLSPRYSGAASVRCWVTGRELSKRFCRSRYWAAMRVWSNGSYVARNTVGTMNLLCLSGYSRSSHCVGILNAHSKNWSRKRKVL